MSLELGNLIRPKEEGEPQRHEDTKVAGLLVSLCLGGNFSKIRRKVTLFFLILLCVPASTACGKIIKGPYIQDVRMNSAWIMWETEQAGPSQLRFARKGKPPRTVSGDEAKIHAIRLEGLRPGTEYRYEVADPGGAASGAFRTAPKPGTPVRFAALGDTRNWLSSYPGGRWRERGFHEHVAKQKIEFMLDAGDLVVDGRVYETWGKEYFPRFADLMGSIPLYPVRGNHERNPKDDPENNWFGRFFKLPGGEPYSSFDWGNVHVTMASYEYYRESHEFIAQDLARSNATWKIVMFHYPVWCTGYFDGENKRKKAGEEKLEQAIEDNGCDILITGHTHIYERSFTLRDGKRDERGVTHVVCGSGRSRAQFPDDWSLYVMPMHHSLDCPQYVVVDAGKRVLDMRGYAYDKQKKEIVEVDRYIRSKDPNYARRLVSQLGRSSGGKLLEVIDALGALSCRPAAMKLVRRMSSRDVRLRRAVSLALGRIAEPSVSARLMKHVNDPDIVVRQNVAWALSHSLRRPQVAAAGRAALKAGQDPDTAAFLLGGIGRAGSPEAESILLEACRSQVQLVRWRAIDMLKKVATQRCIPELERLLAEEKAGLDKLTEREKYRGGEIRIKRPLVFYTHDSIEMILKRFKKQRGEG